MQVLEQGSGEPRALPSPLVELVSNDRVVCHLLEAILDLARDACRIKAEVSEEQVHLALLDELIGYTERERIHLALFFTQNFADVYTSQV